MTLETEQKDKEQVRKPQKRNYKREENNKAENKKPKNNSNKKENTKFEFKKENLKIIPLGGLEEIGKNITVFEYGNLALDTSVGKRYKYLFVDKRK